MSVRVVSCGGGVIVIGVLVQGAEARIRALTGDGDRLVAWFIVIAATATMLMALQYTAIGSPLVEVDEASSTSYAAALAHGTFPSILTATAHGTTGFPATG